MAKPDDVDTTVDALLRGEFFKDGGYYETIADNLAKEIIAGLASDDPRVKVKAARSKGRLRTAVISVFHGGDDPKWVPIKHIKHAVQHPTWAHTPVSEEQLATIDGPTRAIRVFCLNCQGNDTVVVRTCASINCFLWAFRMGHNPFFGRLSAADAEAEGVETDAEIEEAEALRVPSLGEIGHGN